MASNSSVKSRNLCKMEHEPTQMNYQISDKFGFVYIFFQELEEWLYSMNGYSVFWHFSLTL